MKFTIVTKRSVYAPDHNPDNENYVIALYEEQQAKLEELEIDCDATYLLKRGEKTNKATINDAIECLALKDGADLVQFPNGNYGFVGYYNGFRLEENHFEIVKRC